MNGMKKSLLLFAIVSVLGWNSSQCSGNAVVAAPSTPDLSGLGGAVMQNPAFAVVSTSVTVVAAAVNALLQQDPQYISTQINQLSGQVQHLQFLYNLTTNQCSRFDRWMYHFGCGQRSVTNTVGTFKWIVAMMATQGVISKFGNMMQMRAQADLIETEKINKAIELEKLKQKNSANNL